MMKRYLLQQIFLLSIFGCVQVTFVSASEDHYGSWDEVEEKLVATSIHREWIPMRDGVRLDTNIFLPKAGKAPFPTVLVRSPYPDKSMLNLAATIGLYELATFLKQGYAVVFQSERGRFWSEGDHTFMANAREDGYDTIDWLSKQAWSNGKIGTIGCSSSAENQLSLSTEAHPAHAAGIALSAGAGIGKIGPYAEQGNTYRGGALRLMFLPYAHDAIVSSGKGAQQRPTFPKDLSREDRVRLSKHFSLEPRYDLAKGESGISDYEQYFSHLPVADLNKAIDGGRTEWDEFVRRTPADPAWDSTHFANEGDVVGVPMLWGVAWYDVSVGPNIALYQRQRDVTANGPRKTKASKRRGRDQQFMLISPMTHCGFGLETENTVVGERNMGDARYDFKGHYLAWFDYWLKGKKNKVLKKPQVRYYQMGDNQWKSADQFPPKNTYYQDLYLDSNEGANSLYGDGALLAQPPVTQDTGSDGFVYDPLHPVPTHGGGDCCTGTKLKVSGALDQADLEIRNDILVYTSPPLPEDLVVAGFVEVELFVSSSAKDTDFTVKLVDVDPDGRAYNLDDSIFRARYREGYDKTLMMEEGNVYKLEFAPLVTANTFKKGHQIRIEISSSNFPRFSRNLNTGGNNFDESEPVIANNTVHHSASYPSKIRLPITSGSKGKPTRR
jgi:putative CocE/NonD family hydrolase